jgi:hypothetical protein
MIIAIGVMFVTSLLLVAAFTVTNNDIHLSRVDTTQKQAYYAALAGVQQYEYKLQSNPNFWQTCEPLKSNVPEEAGERYEVKILPASSSPGGAACSAANPFNTAIEAEGVLANTFRIKSTGYAGPEKRSLIATFKVTGFLDFIYFTNFETLDPALYGKASLAAQCEGKYYSAWKGKYECENIEFTNGDSVNGPFHTNDTADVGGAASFGREGNLPPDKVEMNGGTYGGGSGCASSAKYYTATKCYTKGPTLVAPESDTSLVAYTETANEFFGATKLALNGAANTIGVTYFNKAGSEVKETVNWPKNGLIYVQHQGACAYKYEYANSDNAAETSEEKGCGNVYVHGTYSKSLTIAGENDVIINGELYPTSVEGKLGSEPSGTAVLGLIASHYVRIYHPCSSGTNGVGSLSNPWIYAAILSTAHSFIVDNFNCGKELGKLHVYGAIAQNYRGAVGTGGGGSTGYIKDYKYDDRLATDEPPYFLQPLKAGWKVIRQTAPTAG